MKHKRNSIKTSVLTILMFLMPVLSPAGNLEPAAAPGPTMHSLEDVYQILKAFKKTPSEVCAGTVFQGIRTDGTIGEMTGTMRDQDNGDGTVTDCLTGLVWLKDADCFGAQPWDDAMALSDVLSSGECGLTDGSSEGDWHLASRDELIAFINGRPYGSRFDESPFVNVQSTSVYWSNYWSNNENSWCVDIYNGNLFVYPNSTSLYVWPVRNQ